MANPFDQFDKPAASGNPFDRFDAVSAPPGRAPTPADIPRDAGSRYVSPAKPVPAVEDSFLGKVWGNVVEPVATVGSGIVGALAGSAVGAGRALASGKVGTQEAIREGDKVAAKVANYLTYQPQTETGKANVQAIGRVMQDSGLAGLPIGPELNAISRLARPAASQAVRAAETDIYAAKQLAKKVAETKVLPKVDADRARLAQKAIDSGIEITPDMLTDNKFARIAREMLEKIPLTGNKGDGRQIAFNRAVTKLIGGNGLKPKLTDDVFQAAIEKSGSKIGEIAAKTDIPLDDGLAGALGSLVDDAQKFDTADNARILGNYADELKTKAAENGGVITGEAYRKLHSKIGRQARKTSDGDLKDSLSNLQEVMDDALERNIGNASDIAALAVARKQYAIAKTIEPLVAKAIEGNISPAALMGRVTADGSGKTRMATGRAGELGDLARIGQQFLKEPASSNSAERGLLLAAATGALSFEPVTASSVLGAANAYNRLGPKVAQRMINNSLDAPVPPARFADELALAEESAFAPRQAAPVADTPYNGLLTADQSPITARTPADELMPNRQDFPSVDYPILEGGGPLPIQRSGDRPALPPGPTVAATDGIDYFGNQAPVPAAAVPDNGLLSLLERDRLPPPAKPIDYNAIEFLPTLDEMDARGPFNGPLPQTEKSKLYERVRQERIRKLNGISGAQSIDDAIRGATGE